MKRSVFLVMLCISFHFSISQNGFNDPIRQWYLSSLKNKQAIKSIDFAHYLLPEFTDGVVLMKNGAKIYALINFNSITAEMVIQKEGVKASFGEQGSELVDTIFIAERKFVTLNNRFVELLYQAKCHLFVEYRVNLNDSDKYSGYGTPSNRTTLHKIYWIKKEDKLIMVSNMRQFKKLYGEKQHLIRDYIRQHDIEFEDPDKICNLVQYIESS